MSISKKRNFEVILIVLVFLVAACGPSPEDLEATSAAETKAAATPTFTITPTPPPTATAAPTATPKPTATPLPEPDPLAMLHWQDLDLPAGFYSVHPEVEEIAQDTTGMTLELGDGETLEYIIAGSFVFVDDSYPSQILYGYAMPLPTTKHRDVFDIYTENYLDSSLSTGFGISSDECEDIPGADQVGDISAGVTGSYFSSMFGATWQISRISFRVGDVGVFVFLRNAAKVQSPIDLGETARIYAESIQFPQQTCQITSVNPDPNASVPTFDFEAEGFYPREVRYIHLIGQVMIGGKETGAVSMKMGGGGESFDLNGSLRDTISFLTSQQLATQGSENDEFPTEYTLVVGGYFSGCEVEQIVTWPPE